MGRPGVIAHAAYDRLAPHYRRYAAGRAAYLSAVDRYVVEHAARGARMLDVGAGDGVRGMNLARLIGASRLVLCDSSPRMAALCREQQADEVWELDAQALPADGAGFEVITCLWNVLGHLQGRGARVAALTGMRRLLAPDGRIFCDVNNRHNAHAYGRTRVMLRRLMDGMVRNDKRGDSTFEWNVAGERIPVTGHLFTPREMRDLVDSAGLEIEERLAVDYVTGIRSSALWNGQLVYRLRAARGSDGDAGR